MPTSVSLGYCPWLAGNTWSDTIGRLDVASETVFGGTRGGVLQSATNPLAVLAASGMNITINAGSIVIPSSSGAANGAYRVTNTATQTLTVTTAPVSPNNRIDIVVAQVVDNGNNTSFSELQIIAGTPAVSPVAPATPSNAIVLASIFVGFGVVSINQGNITDTRFYTASAGGVPYFPSTASLPAGIRGLLAYDNTASRFFHWADTGYKPFTAMPWTPAHVVGNGNAALTGLTTSGNATALLTFGTQAMSAAITTDGQTDIKITARWGAISMASPALTQLTMQLFIDSTQLDETDIQIGDSGATYAIHGDMIEYITNTASSDTPTAGAHTIQWRAVAQRQASSQTVTIISAAHQNAYMRVEPVML